MFAEVNGTSLYFDVEGSGYVAQDGKMARRPACLVLHGGPGLDHTYFKPWLSPLAQHMQLVYIDHRGNGQSARTGNSTYTMEQFADDVDGVRRHLGLERVYVLGNSFGGFIALHCALRHTEHLAGLILSNTAPSGGFADEMMKIVEQRATEEQKRTIGLLFAGQHTDDEHYTQWWRIMSPYYFHNPDATIMRNMVDHLTVNVRVANYMFPNEFPSYDLVGKLGLLISVPTLVIGGRHDGIIPPSQSELIHQAIPGSRLTIFENSGHFPFIEEQDGFNTLVAEFVTERAHVG